VSGSTAAIAALGGFLVVVIASGPMLMFVIERRLPWGISRRLQRGRKSITIRTRYAGGAWNPAKPRGPGNRTPNEPGWATYTLTSDGLIRLDLVRTDGRREQFVGPPVEPPEGYARTRRAGAIPTLAYVLSAGAGSALAYGLTDSRATPNRVQSGVLGAVAGWVIAWLGLTVTLAVWHSRLRRADRPATGDEPAE